MGGIISSIEKRARLESPRVPISSASAADILGLGQSSAAGVSVTHERALGITAFWAGVRMISQTVAGLPCKVYERVGEKKRRPSPEHPAYKLLFKRPNKFMSSFTFKEIRMAHLLTWGNSYAEIERDKAGRPIALWPLLPDRTDVEIVNGEKIYHTIINNERIRLSADRVLHVPGLGFDGLRGYNVVRIHRDSLGLTIAANEYGAQFFNNSARPSGYLEHPGNPEAPERAQIRDEWNQMHQGLTNAQRTAVLWGGMKWQQMSIPPEDAQYLETRQMQIEEVARILNINPILLQHHEKVTTWGTGVGQFLIAYSKFTITPWLDREEDILDWDMFTEEERGRFYTKYNVGGLLRGDMKEQAEILEIERRNGILSANDWLELKDENPLPGPEGDARFVPLNWIPLDQAVNEQQGQDPPDPPDEKSRLAKVREGRSLAMRRRLRAAHLRSFEDGARRYVKRDIDALSRALKKAFDGGSDPVKSLERWIEDFYPGQQQHIYRTMLPLVSALASVIAADAAEEVSAEPEDVDKFAADYTENLARREAGSSRGQLLALIAEMPEEELQDAITTRTDEWNEKRPGKVAADEIVRVAAGAARWMWTMAGMTYLVWRAGPNACPICKEMDGRRIGIKDYFLMPGESVGDLTAEVNVGGPPLHGGCECDVVPE